MLFQETGKDALSSSSHEGTFEDLRKSIASIAGDLRQVAEARGRVTKEQTQNGVHALRRAIRRHPVLALGTALLAGSALALIAVPNYLGRRPTRRAAWLAPMPSISRVDLHALADTIQRNAIRTANSVQLASSLERLADAITQIEPSESLISALGKASAWIKKIRSGAQERRYRGVCLFLTVDNRRTSIPRVNSGKEILQ
jgi:hypothetical protein